MWRDLILGWAKTLVAAHYRVVAIGAEDAGRGPVVVVSNHTNGLVDAVVLIRASRRRLHFLAKQELMRMPVLGWLARGAGAVPVYRKKDNVPTSWNDGAFDAIHRALAGGHAIGVFPEGTSHLDPGIRPLRTGAARIALGAEEAARWRLGVHVVPVGIHYEARDTVGSRVLAVVGPPLDVAGHRGQHRDAPWDTALELTGEIHQALEAVRVELGEHDAAPLVALVLDELAEGVLAPGAAPARLRALVDGHREHAARDADGARARLERLRALDASRRSGPGAVALRVLRWAAGLAWAPPIVLAYLLRRALPLPVDKCATVLCLAGTVLFPLWLVALPLWGGARYGAAAGWGVVALLAGAAIAGLWATRARFTLPLGAAAAEERARLAAELDPAPAAAVAGAV